MRVGDEAMHRGGGRTCDEVASRKSRVWKFAHGRFPADVAICDTFKKAQGESNYGGRLLGQKDNSQYRGLKRTKVYFLGKLLHKFVV